MAWQQSLLREDGPSCLLLSRQPLPHAGDGHERIGAITSGAYGLRQPAGERVGLLATGSEVGVAPAAARVTPTLYS